jgi:ATP-dependent helicase HrpA
LAAVHPDVTIRDAHRLGGRTGPELERAQARYARRLAAVPVVSYPPELPVSARRDELLEVIRDNQVVVVAGETGSGKTTQLPKICLELGRGVRGSIAHTQPRRLAARTIAERIAEELDVALGEAVGYAVRFNDRSSEHTLLRLMTDGLLLAEIGRDRLLRRYDTIIVDEAHERSLNVDFLLGYLKRILPDRPDLKLIITSATIDPQRFAAHFDDAPVVEVSGRTYPVEVRYRPLEDDDDQADAITAAVGEVPGDVLVFLSGEREIRDTAEALQGRVDAEVLPLYARLAASEQQRVFHPTGSTRRIVLATNVAETSLTVPGIRSVVDPGLARISRYSARLKVQRLPIEPVSQASADQRKGRCGRTSDGVCVRLYSEEDFAERPRFTDPEILRTNLASVLLQMAALGLGAVEDFPFLDPPDARQIRDGVNLLFELGAFDEERRLTPLGRRLARLPVDPRFGRMILEAGGRGCAREVCVIAAGLAIQDPRERPTHARAQADASHARFAGEDSDFLAYLKLHTYVREQRRALTGNQFRKRLKAEHLHYLRVREWQDLAGQLRTASRAVGVQFNEGDAEPREIHQALLAGLLSHVGMRDKGERGGGPASGSKGASDRPRHPRTEYVGARGARFAIFPGSGLAKKQPDWIMAAELVETARLWGREVARIDPKWIEPLAGHLVRREHADPRWDERRAGVVATERLSLYGLPIGSKTVAHHDRDLFIRRALIEGDWHARHAFLAENRRRIEEVEAIEERTRQRGLLVTDDVLADFFAARIPADVASGAAFDRWFREQDPELLVYPRELLRASGADGAGRPETWKQGELVLPLTYRFEPGAPDDGVTAHVPLAALPELRDVGFDWLVPALREELVTALLRGLPKDKRRPLAPMPDTVRRVTEALRPRKGRLVGQVAALVGLTEADFAGVELPPHLRMTFAVEDPSGATVAFGDDLAALREQVRPLLRASLGAAARDIEQTGLRDWPAGAFPRTLELPGVVGFPALVDEGEAVALRVLESPAAQTAAHRGGVSRLLRLALPAPPAPTDLAFATAEPGLVTDIADAVADELVAKGLPFQPLGDEGGGLPWDAAGWRALRGDAAGRWAGANRRAQQATADVLRAAADVRTAIERRSGDALRETRLDVARQLGRLLHPGFVSAAGVARLPDLFRYLQAAERRLERAPDALAQDRDRMATLRELEALGPDRWLLEELRVSYYAPALARPGVSAKRVRQSVQGAR